MAEYTEEQIKRFEGYVKLYVDDSITDPDERIAIISKRNQRMWFFLVANIAAILLFSLTYFLGDKNFSNVLYIILLVVFSINLVVIFYQKSQLQKTIDYLRQKKKGNSKLDI